MPDTKPWNPLNPLNPGEAWRDQKISWIRVQISPEELRHFTRRSNWKGLLHATGFLILLLLSGTWAYGSLAPGHWIQLFLALYLHSIIFGHIGDALHELGHNTVFASRWLSKLFIRIYGLIAWTWNPYFYSLSHNQYHHRYTLHQGSDGEDVPGYQAPYTPWTVVKMFLPTLQWRSLLQNLGRLLTLRPTSKGWRGRGFELDAWEQFILNRAKPEERKRIRRFGIWQLLVQLIFLLLCGWSGLWFLPLLWTLAPFYGPGFHGFLCGIHQHTGCNANEPDFRKSCGDVILDSFSSFLYWHMEFHIEHHMFAAIPCYNLKKFSRFVSEQLPVKERLLPRLRRLPQLCREKYGSQEEWYQNIGRYEG